MIIVFIRLVKFSFYLFATVVKFLHENSLHSTVIKDGN